MSNDNKNLPANFRRNLTVSVGLILLAGFLLSVFYATFISSRQATAETMATGQQFSKQSELLIRPLLLSSDRVSLNYLLNELQQLDHVAGLEVVDANGFVIARSGVSSKLKLQTRLSQQDNAIGSITLWLDATPAKTRLLKKLWPISLIALLTIVIALGTLWLSCRDVVSDHEAITENDKPEEPSFEETLQQQTIDNTYQQPSPATTDQLSSSASPEDVQTSNTSFELPVQQSIEPTTLNSDTRDLLETSSLVDLLKPDASSTQQMPKFEHHPDALEEPPEETPAPLVYEEESVEKSASTSTSRGPLRSENPLLKNIEDREEVQLDLYSFEHELELILPPQDAIYLFYIDSHTASSENMNPNEKATLLNVYHHLAKQVARIYNGEAELLENKDILLRFELRDDGDSHGVNAVCAAMLFSLLYKGFNQSRIRGFQPVLSLQMSLARGHHDKHSLVKEEAHFLTRTTSSNELISHTALTEAPKLKEAMFEAADIRREDEDKVLLLKVTPKHQALLQKQANHLLTKIFAKNQS